MLSLKNILASVAAATLVSGATAAQCTVEGSQSSTQNIITVKKDGNKIGGTDSVQCINSDDPNMIDCGLEYPVAVHEDCGESGIQSCSVDYGPQHGIQGDVQTGTGVSDCTVTFDC